MGQGMSDLMGAAPSTVESTRTDPNMAGPMPGSTTAGSGVLGALSSMANISKMFGDTPEERANNAKVFAAMTKDVGNTVKGLSESTLMQRFMQQSMKGPKYLGGGASPAGGVAAIPKTFDPAMASQIMNHFGYK